MPVTIDNLGAESSRKYAEGQAQLDLSLIKDSQSIPVHTGVSVLKPSFPRELETLLHSQPTTTTWSLLLPPEQYYGRAHVPSLLKDRLDVHLQKIAESPPEKEESSEEHARAQHKLQTCLTLLKQQQQMIIETNSKRSQYQKG